MRQLNVLVFPCGSEIGLELHRSLKDVRFITLFGASSTADHGESVYKNYCGGLPFITEPGFLQAFIALLEEKRIDLVFPALDSVLAFLSAHRAQLPAALLTSCNDTVQVCRDKALTYARLSGCDFLPEVYASPAEVKAYPVLLKPAVGQGAQGVQVIPDEKELTAELARREAKQVICEYLPGAEYTADCFTDSTGALRYVSLRTRERVRSGISVRSALCPADDRVREIAETINRILPMRGVWFFQLKRNAAGEYRLLECATRVAGAMCLSRAAGVNLPLLTVFDALDMDVVIAPQTSAALVDRALYNVFSLPTGYSEVYIDYDDTLIINGRVNFTVLRFIYQCVERKIRVTLLTRHETDVREDMLAYRIFPALFDAVVCIPRSEKKTDHVRPAPNALLIDDSFAERTAFVSAFGGYAYGPDAVEALIDERV